MKCGIIKCDIVLLGIIGVLIMLGILILAGISAPLSQQKIGNPTYFLFHQILFGIIAGIIAGFIFYKIPLSLIKKYAPGLLLINIFFLGLVFVPMLGISSAGAHRWINLGFVSFQPSEFLKIFFILYLASWLTSKHKNINSANRKFRFYNPKQKILSLNLNKLFDTLSKTFFPFLVILGFIGIFLIKQPDASTLGIIALVAGIMYFSIGTPLWHSILIFLMGAGSLYALVKTAPYRMNRFMVFLNPEIEPMGIGYQLKQSLIAIGSGGILGLGLGMSRQKFVFLPQSMSDSIFSIFAEETGLAGGLILIFLFLLFLWKCFNLAKKTSDEFSRLVCLGISSWITIQAFINISAMAGIFPLTGIPLPFISYGGSHIIAELIGVGILLNISKNKKL
jgi:cell division protein FtsW